MTASSLHSRAQATPVMQALRAQLHSFLEQQGPQLLGALLRAAADSCPTQLLRPLALLLHPLLSGGPLQAARRQLLGQILAETSFPGEWLPKILKLLSLLHPLLLLRLA